MIWPVVLAAVTALAAPAGGPPVEDTALPLGDHYVSTTGPAQGWAWSCVPGNPSAPGNIKEGPWIGERTWNLLEKFAVQGENSWEDQAVYRESTQEDTRVLTTNKVPARGTTGNFPIASSDPAYEYDHNPGRVSVSPSTVVVDRTPAKAASPSCLPMGAIGIAVNGVLLYNPLDARGKDARAHEMLDSCEGHPSPSEYHYHAGSICAVAQPKPGKSVLFGYAGDGFGIYLVRDKQGRQLTNSDLDACHGRTAKVKWNGRKQKVYHYVVTQEFPYLLGCFAGTNTLPAPSPPPRPRP